MIQRYLFRFYYFTARCIENHKEILLDLDITIDEHSFITEIYHKVDDFDFEVVSCLFPTSNMLDCITYAVCS